MGKSNNLGRGQGGKRFAVVTDRQVEDATMPNFAVATIRASEGAWAAFCEWRKSNELVSKVELGGLLSRFSLEHRKQDGEDYKSSSLMSIMRNVVRKAFLLSVEAGEAELQPWKFDHDPEFASARNAVDRRMSELQQQPGDATIKATPFSEEELGRLFGSDMLSTETAKGLLNRLYFVIGLSTAARIQWHTNAKWSSLSSVQVTEGGLRYRTVPVGVDKNHPGGRSFETECYYLIENQLHEDRCPLKLIELYANRRPPSAADRLYLGIIHGDCVEREHWYLRQPMGINTLAKIVPTIAASVGILPDKSALTRYSNHSLRATLPTILYQKEFDEQLISVVTKHRSLHGIRSYKRTSVQLLSIAASAVMSGTTGTKVNTCSVILPQETGPDKEVTSAVEELMKDDANSAKSVFQNCSFTGCNFK